MRLLLILAIIISLFKINEGADWCYESQDPCATHCKGPGHWKDTTNANGCAGRSQSPINIVTKRTLLDQTLTPFKFSGYQNAFKSSISNNGHSVQVNVATTATISAGNLSSVYKAVQFHLHWGSEGGPGSEHTVDGEQYPMEVPIGPDHQILFLEGIEQGCPTLFLESYHPLHIVHMKQAYSSLSQALQDSTGVAVLGVFFEESSRENRNYEPIINALIKIKKSGTNVTINIPSLMTLLPPSKYLTNYYRYQGSLTTPGCAESVVWTVFEHPVPLSKTQLEAFSELNFKDGKPMVHTFRPVQPLNDRKVYRSASNMVMASSLQLTVLILAAIGLLWPN